MKDNLSTYYAIRAAKLISVWHYYAHHEKPIFVVDCVNEPTELHKTRLLLLISKGETLFTELISSQTRHRGDKQVTHALTLRYEVADEEGPK